MTTEHFPDGGKEPAHPDEERASLMAGLNYQHKKTGRKYTVIGYAVCSSDDDNDGKMMLAYNSNSCGLMYVTRLSRFMEKFTLVVPQ